MGVHVTSAVWAHASASANDLLVLLALADVADNDSRLAYPGVQRMAQFARVDERTVQRCLRRLEAAGEIVLVRKGGKIEGRNRPAVYRVLSGLPDDLRRQFVTPDAQGRQPVLFGGDTGGDSGVTPVSPELSEERSEELSGTSAISPAQQVRETWLSLDALPAHRDSYFKDDSTRYRIRKAVDKYGVDDVCAAIRSYALVLASDDHVWSHRWTLIDFLQRGLDRFVPEAKPEDTFRKRVNGSNGSRADRHEELVRSLRDPIG